MTALQAKLADLPQHAAGAVGGRANPDVLSEVLRAVRLSGSVFLDGRFAAPFGVISPARWDGTLPAAHMRHASVFHLVVEGHCRMETAEGGVFDLAGGDVVLLPFTAEHKFWAGDPDGFMDATDLVKPGLVDGVYTCHLRGDGEETRFVCGLLESGEMLAAPLFRSLPHVLIDHTNDDPLTGMLAKTAAEILRQLELGEPGAPLLLGRLMELLFVEVLRRHASRLPPGATGLRAALNDPVIGRALQAIHAEPARRWDLESLAREAGASRTLLAERFNAVVGKPPIEYLAGWRLQLAAERLRACNDSIGRVAEHVGYDSEAAFSRAFKRVMGESPGRWRRGVGV
jgi:AraC-like DNA-binding protein